MASEDVTILDLSCHSLLLLIIVTITFFTWNFPHPQRMEVSKSLSILIPAVIMFILLWSGNLIHQSHAHNGMYEAHYASLYPIYLIYYTILIAVNYYWLIRKYYKEKDELLHKQILMLTIGLIITNLISFIFGLFLPWFLGFYFLVEMSPAAFLVGVILFTAVSVGKYNMFPATLARLHNFSIKKKIFLSSLILVPIIILLVQIPLIKIIFNLKSNNELMHYFLVSVFGGIVVSISIAFVIIKVISNPLNKLKSEAHEIELGNYGFRIELNSHDELGELTEAFNNMSSTLKRNSTELLKKEERISLLLNAFDKSSAAIAVVNNDFKVIEANSEFRKIISDDESSDLTDAIKIDSSIENLQFSRDRKYFNNIKYKLESEKSFNGEINYNGKILLLSVTPSSFKKGVTEGYLFIEVDITELKKLQEQLLKSEKLAALGKMAAVLAHEIKTPLTSIKMNADIIAETLDLNEEDNTYGSVVKENFEIMTTEINRLNNLVKDVLKFSRQMELEYSDSKLKDLIDIVHNQLLNKLEEKNITFINNTENICFRVDADKIKQVFINLIDNSIEAVNQNGVIQIDSQRDGDNNFVSIFVKDNGTGIDPELKVFEPFFTTKSSGTGLGLPISQKIIEQHNGAFYLLSSKKGETIFELKLPLEHKHLELNKLEEKS
jgi:PAS domain S-box-containing protein